MARQPAAAPNAPASPSSPATPFAPVSLSGPASPPAPVTLPGLSDDAAPLWALADRGQVALATQGLIRLLTARPDDSAALLAARLLQRPPAIPADAASGTVLSASMARLVTLVRTQDTQITALLDLLDE